LLILDGAWTGRAYCVMTSSKFGLGIIGGEVGERRVMTVCSARGWCERADIKGIAMRANVVVSFMIAYCISVGEWKIVGLAVVKHQYNERNRMT